MLHFFPVVLDGIRRVQGPASRLSSSESCINTQAQRLRLNPTKQIEMISAASPFKNSIHLSCFQNVLDSRLWPGATDGFGLKYLLPY